MTVKVQRFHEASSIARHLATETKIVTGWANRPTANFPLPLSVVVDKDGKERPLWDEDQIPLLREWLALRLNLSDPATHWARVDRGEKDPGNHQDQMAMFAVERTAAQREPDGLFAL